MPMHSLDKPARNAIRLGYNRVVTERRPAYVPLPSLDLLFLLAVDAGSGAFQAGLVRRSDCRFEEGKEEPATLPETKLYAASFDFVNGLRAVVDEARLDAPTAAAVRAVHAELEVIFRQVAEALLQRRPQP